MSATFTRYLLTCCLALAVALGLPAQDLEATYNNTRSRLKDQPVRITGGLTLGGQFATTSGGLQRYDNFDWGLQARMNFDVLGWSVPFSAFISDRNRLYNLPSYQFVGLSPSYRWAQIHLGDRGMNFNQYTFSNQQFRGAGVELTPGKWRVAGFRGRLNRLQLSDLSARQSIAGSYRRMGQAASVGYNGETFSLTATMFHAEDQVPDTMTLGVVNRLAPARNTVGSLEGDVRIAKNIQLNATVASSWLTDDVQAIGVPDSIYRARFGGNASSSRETAIRSNLTYSRPKTNWTLGYERLSPNYRSLGTLYLTPDRENITAGATTVFFDGKATLAVNGGVQRNNLADDRKSSQRRIITQIAATARPAERLFVNLSLSNFNQTSRVRSFLDPTTNTDSIFLAQVNRSAALGLNWQRDKKAGPGGFNLNFSIQDAQSIQDEQLTDFTSTLYNTYLGYTGRIKGPAIDFQTQFLLAINDAVQTNRTYGPSIALSRTLANDKLSLGLTGSYSWVDFDTDALDGRILLSRLVATWQVFEKGSLQGHLQYSRRRSGERDPFNETLAALQYNWNF